MGGDGGNSLLPWLRRAAQAQQARGPADDGEDDGAEEAEGGTCVVSSAAYSQKSKCHSLGASYCSLRSSLGALVNGPFS